MPIYTGQIIGLFDQSSFQATDTVVTGMAFDIHNEFGRFLQERLYQVELLRRLQNRGVEALREMKISVILDDFVKDYFLDLLVSSGVIVETKAVEAISSAHRAQLLNYLFLCGLRHGTLLNFRGERVQHEFVSRQLTPEKRKQVVFIDNEWEPLTDRCKILATVLKRAMADWGSCLAPTLYRDAITHFLGGDAQVVRDIPVFSEEIQIGTQIVHLLSDDVAFSITSSVHRPNVVHEHHRRFLKHTNLKAIQWVNLNRQTITFVTITK